MWYEEIIYVVMNFNNIKNCHIIYLFFSILSYELTWFNIDFFILCKRLSYALSIFLKYFPPYFSSNIFLIIYFFLTPDLLYKKVLFLPLMHLFLPCYMFICCISLFGIFSSSPFLLQVVCIEVSQLKLVKIHQLLIFLTILNFSTVMGWSRWKGNEVTRSRGKVTCVLSFLDY